VHQPTVTALPINAPLHVMATMEWAHSQTLVSVPTGSSVPQAYAITVSVNLTVITLLVLMTSMLLVASVRIVINVHLGTALTRCVGHLVWAAPATDPSL
jgi:hypothetical protein